MNRLIRLQALLLIWLVSSGPLTAEEAPKLSFPVDCELGKSCFIQHYVDSDPGPTARDYACGAATYNGHDGVDIRLLSAAAANDGVSILAAADGRVLRARDGIGDVFVSEGGRQSVSDRECGNGVVVAHSGNRETQYCHMQNGSIVVTPGQDVKRGTVLGKIGYSGLASFAHLHFAVRQGGVTVDPFTGAPGGRNAVADLSCPPDGHVGRPGPGSLWDNQATERFTYAPAEVIQAAFSSSLPTWQQLERDHRTSERPTSTSPRLLLFARVINFEPTDRLHFAIEGPENVRVDATTPPPDRHKAIFVGAAGRRLTGLRWPAGSYRGVAEIVRNGHVLSRATATLELN